jgi:hypothetical protein
VPRNNMFKIGVATAAAAVGAILAITSVFAHTTPSSNGRSVVGGIVAAAHAASFPLVANDPALNVLANEQITDQEEAAELAAELAAQQAEQAKEAAAAAAEAAAEAANTDTDDVNEDVDTETDDDTGAAAAATAQVKTQHHDGGDHQSD